MEQKIKEAVLAAGSLVRAIPALRDAGVPPEMLAVLEKVAEAESELASARGKKGERDKLKPAKIELIEKLLAENLSYGEIARQAKVSKATVHMRAKRIQEKKTQSRAFAKGLEHIGDDLWTAADKKEKEDE